ncbi:hypothetical protein BOX15_Mlig020241g1 [Macrostomum lignano]|uniref:Uncharacterized protein n=1 Tax=Macrostomum lignano TaxID=282301 RepID=A0A267ES91_9PLAT|nr:hypothetical protein BOX15_Mlig020241g1 [Macrostomum lignano]
MLNSLSASKSSACRLFRELDSVGATAASACWSASQESLASLEEFSCLEVALDCLDDIAQDNYQFVVEEMFFEAVIVEVNAELRRQPAGLIAEQLIETTVRAQAAACCLAAVSQKTRGPGNNRNSNNNHWSSRVDHNNDTTFCDLDLDYEGCQMAKAEWLSRPIAEALDRLYEVWTSAAVEEVCLETLVELVCERLVQVLYKSSHSKSQFECRIVKAVGRFNQTLDRLAATNQGERKQLQQQQRRLDAGRVADSFFDCVVDTVADPDSRRASNAMTGILLAAVPDEPGDFGGGNRGSNGVYDNWRLLGIARAAFVRSIRGQLSRLAKKSQEKHAAQSLKQQRRSALAAHVLDVGNCSLSDELESLPSDTETASISAAPPNPTVATRKTASGSSRSSGRQVQQQQQRCFPYRLERISEAPQHSKLSAAVELEVRTLAETAAPTSSTQQQTEEAAGCISAGFGSRLVRISASYSEATEGDSVEIRLAPAGRVSCCCSAASSGRRAKILALTAPSAAFASELSAGRAEASATLATVATVGPSLLDCSTMAADSGAALKLPVTLLALSAAEASAAAVVSGVEFATAAVPAVAPVLIASMVHRPRPLMRLARCRFVLRRLDAAPQSAVVVRVPQLPLATPSPLTNRCVVDVPAIWSVHAGVRPSRSHCCPLSHLPEPPPRLPGASGSHLSAAAKLDLAPAPAIRLNASTQPTVGTRSVGVSAGRAARSAPTPWRANGTGAASIGDVRQPGSSLQLPATERALATAADQPAPGGGALWPERPVRHWLQARQSTGWLRPTLSPVTLATSTPAAAVSASFQAELFDSSDSVGAFFAAPFEAPEVCALGGLANSLPILAIDCQSVECRLEADRVAGSEPTGGPTVLEPPTIWTSATSVNKFEDPDEDWDDDGARLETVITIQSIFTVGIVDEEQELEQEQQEDETEVGSRPVVMAIETPRRRPLPGGNRIPIGRSRSASSSGSSTASSIDGLPVWPALWQRQQQMQIAALHPTPTRSKPSRQVEHISRQSSQ